MRTVNILSDNPRWKDRSILFFLYKWNSDFLKAGIKLNFFYDHHKFLEASADEGIILSRYFSEWQNIQKRSGANHDALVTYLGKAKKVYNRIFWFDVSDGTGSTDFSIIKYVDVFLKKQVLKNRHYYTEDHGRKSVRIWLQDTGENINTNFDYYDPCPPEELHKIRIAWNLGMCDYRYFPHYTRVLSNYWLGNPTVKEPGMGKEIDISFRGNASYDKTNLISFQRNKVFECLPGLNGQVIAGGIVSRKQYLDEIGKSKICISPFGWGEICYRDFEAFLYGCVLVKPTVDYMDTFPNVFFGDKTYISTSLDMSDIRQRIQYTIDNYPMLKEIAVNGQNEYLKYITDKNHLVDHFTAMIATN